MTCATKPHRRTPEALRAKQEREKKKERAKCEERHSLPVREALAAAETYRADTPETNAKADEQLRNWIDAGAWDQALPFATKWVGVGSPTVYHKTAKRFPTTKKIDPEDVAAARDVALWETLTSDDFRAVPAEGSRYWLRSVLCGSERMEGEVSREANRLERGGRGERFDKSADHDPEHDQPWHDQPEHAEPVEVEGFEPTPRSRDLWECFRWWRGDVPDMTLTEAAGALYPEDQSLRKNTVRDIRGRYPRQRFERIGGERVVVHRAALEALGDAICQRPTYGASWIGDTPQGFNQAHEPIKHRKGFGTPILLAPERYKPNGAPECLSLAYETGPAGHSNTGLFYPDPRKDGSVVMRHHPGRPDDPLPLPCKCTGAEGTAWTVAVEGRAELRRPRHRDRRAFGDLHGLSFTEVSKWIGPEVPPANTNVEDAREPEPDTETIFEDG